MKTDSPLETMLATHITPMLHSAGFLHNGTTYLRTFPGGTHRIHFSTIETEPDQLAVRLLLGVNTHGYDTVRGRSHGMLDHSPLLWNDPLCRDGTTGHWTLDPTEAVGPLLASMLRRQWLPELALLGDLPWVEAQARAGYPFNNWNGFALQDQARTLLFVIAAQRDDPDIDHYAARIPDADLWLPHLPRGR